MYEYNIFSSLCPALWGDYVVIPISSDSQTKYLHYQHNQGNSQYGKQPQQVAVTDDVTVYSLNDFCISIIQFFEVLHWTACTGPDCYALPAQSGESLTMAGVEEILATRGKKMLPVATTSSSTYWYILVRYTTVTPAFVAVKCTQARLCEKTALYLTNPFPCGIGPFGPGSLCFNTTQRGSILKI